MAVKFTNNAVTTLTAGISAGVTQFAVASNSGFPSLGGADHTYLTIGSEVVKVTAISGTTFTCIATSSSHANGDNVELRMTAELLDDFATDLEAMPKTGGVFTGNVSLNDNVRLGLGNNAASGSDLIIYHDGTNSHVNTSVGDLRLSTADAGSSVQILGSGETLAEFSDDGDVDLFHNGTLKFSTTATGINVVGNIVVSGTVDGVDLQTLNSAVTANTAKTGITSSQATAITNNTAKTGITSGQASAITANTSKVTNATHSGEVTGSGALTIANDAVTTAKLNLISTSSVPSIEARSDGTTDGYIQLNCTANTHGIKLKSPPHSAGASYTLTFPNDDGDANQYLKTNGSGVLDWDTVDALPSQSGQSGRYLTTNGTVASWGVLNTDSNTTTKGLYEMANTIATSYSITSGNNALTAGPITINNGVSVTVPSGSTWVIA